MTSKLLNLIKYYDTSYFIDNMRYHTFYLYNNHDNTFKYEQFIDDKCIKSSIIKYEDIYSLITDEYIYVYFNGTIIFDIFNNDFEL